MFSSRRGALILGGYPDVGGRYSCLPGLPRILETGQARMPAPRIHEYGFAPPGEKERRVSARDDRRLGRSLGDLFVLSEQGDDPHRGGVALTDLGQLVDPGVAARTGLESGADFLE